ncbi:MAG: nucleotidyltransferase family protein [Acidobacteriota bacterium]
MSALETLEAKRTQIQAVAAKHGAGNVRVFGSVVRGDARPDSDVDFLIDVIGHTTPWFPGGLLNDLEALIGRRVDVVTTRSLNPLMRDNILREARPL